VHVLTAPRLSSREIYFLIHARANKDCYASSARGLWTLSLIVRVRLFVAVRLERASEPNGSRAKMVLCVKRRVICVCGIGVCLQRCRLGCSLVRLVL
jgi:hypothetical protein